MVQPHRVTRYWDSSCFLAIFNDEERAEECMAVLSLARRKKTLIYLSPLVPVEVVRPKGRPSPLPLSDRERVRAMFDNDYFRWRIMDRHIAEMSQDLCWENGIKPRDAVHVAAALDVGCDLLETFDKDLLKWNGKLRGASLRICRPGDPPAGSLFESSSVSAR